MVVRKLNFERDNSDDHLETPWRSERKLTEFQYHTR